MFSRLPRNRKRRELQYKKIKASYQELLMKFDDISKINKELLEENIKMRENFTETICELNKAAELLQYKLDDVCQMSKDTKIALQYEYILKHVNMKPSLCIVCGSGLGELRSLVENCTVIPYAEIPGFPVSTVPGHAGNLIFGTLSGKFIVMMQGRFHCYEGNSSKTITEPIKLMKMLGVETILMTNAAGGINKNFKVGDFCVINDHINMASLTGRSPLIGPNDPNEGPRFPPCNKIYTRELINLFKETAAEFGENARTYEGVYFYNMGPNFESPAEINMFARMGADLIGMSTVFEATMASYYGMKVLAVSLVTNECVMSIHENREPNHKEVLDASKKRSDVLIKIFARLVSKLD